MQIQLCRRSVRKRRSGLFRFPLRDTSEFEMQFRRTTLLASDVKTVVRAERSVYFISTNGKKIVRKRVPFNVQRQLNWMGEKGLI